LRKVHPVNTGETPEVRMRKALDRRLKGEKCNHKVKTGEVAPGFPDVPGKKIEKKKKVQRKIGGSKALKLACDTNVRTPSICRICVGGGSGRRPRGKGRGREGGGQGVHYSNGNTIWPRIGSWGGLGCKKKTGRGETGNEEGAEARRPKKTPIDRTSNNSPSTWVKGGSIVEKRTKTEPGKQRETTKTHPERYNQSH